MDKKVKRNFLSVEDIPEKVSIKQTEEGDNDTISEARTEINYKEVENEFNYYHILRRVLYPFALTGAPIGFCLKDPDKLIKILSLFGLMNVNKSKICQDIFFKSVYLKRYTHVSL